MRGTLIFFVYLVLLYPIFGQTKAQRAFEIGMDINKKEPENYILPLNEIKKSAPADGDQAGFHIWCQAMATYHSFVGDLENAIGYFDNRYRKDLQGLTVDCDTNFFKTHKFVDARDFVLETAKDKSVVMLNEAHHIPSHRAFALSLLEELYNQGFRYFAVEDLSNMTINDTKLVTDTTGSFYGREPMYGELIREGLKRGFTLIEFDSRETFNGAGRDRYYVNRSRDSVMAKNLANVLADDPLAKVFIYTGYDHVFEGSKNGWKHMGEFLRDFTGVDPLSISQSQHIEHVEPKLESKEFRAANNLGAIRKPIIALHADSVFHDRYVDISIISPRYINSSSRPAYLTLGGARKAYVVATSDSKDAVFVQAFYNDGVEKGHRIPADQMIMNGKSDTLFLFPGDYNVEFKNSEGILTHEMTINVP